MSNPTTTNALVMAATDHFLPDLLKTEDFDTFETNVAKGIRSIGARCIARAIEAFDASLRSNIPPGWQLHEVAPRRLVTLLGNVTYTRTIYLDQYGRRRIWADEILGIPKHKRLSAGAFLWVVKSATELSYRKTADAFYEMTGSRISHVTVMNCVQEEGRMLLSAPPEPTHISQDQVFVEVDGLHVHLQSHEHREHALPRFLYEQARRTVSFELKMACAYAGKRLVGNGRTERGNLSIVVADEEPDAFWKRVYDQVTADYVEEDISELWVGHDGGAWCGTQRLDAATGANTLVIGSLDPFHVMKYVTRAFPDGPERQWAISLAHKGKGLRLAEMTERIALRIPAGTHREKLRELASYARNNATDLRFPKSSMGTMEGTNFHVGAKRCKNNGTSWSRTGAEAMCVVRAALLTGRPLIPPSKGQLFTEKEEAKRLEALDWYRVSTIPMSSGVRGKTLPILETNKAMRISISRRCG